MSLTYDVTDFRSLTGDPFEGKIPVAGGGGADSGDRTTSGNHSVGGSYVYTVSPTQLNEFRLGFVRATVTQDTLLGATQLPQTQLAFGATTGGSTYKPLWFKDDNFSLADHYSWLLGRHIVRGPGFANLDTSVFKSFLLRERFTPNLRLEAFNATNTPHFANPNTDLSQGQFGSITQTIGNSRILQLAEKLLF